MITAAFLCLVASVTDGDTLRCQDGTRIRIAGIEANELKGGCHLPVCPTMPAQEARRVVERLTLGKTLRCRQVATSYRRIVADCTVEGRSLSCAVLAGAAGVRWDAYWRRYRMEPCNG